MAPGAAVPRVGQQVDIMVGDPIAVEDLLDAARSRGWSDDQLYRAITQRVGLVLYSLKVLVAFLVYQGLYVVSSPNFAVASTAPVNIVWGYHICGIAFIVYCAWIPAIISHN